MLSSPMHHSRTIAALRMVALLEGAKGLLVLLTGFGLLALIHKDLHDIASQVVRHLHLNPSRHLPTVFLDLADRITDRQIWLAAFSAMAYAVVRLVEGVGLWMQRRWAEWFGLLSGGLYIPLEVYEVVRKTSWPRVTVLVINLIVVVCLARVVSFSPQGGPSDHSER